MALKVIGAGLGRTGTLSLKFALEHLGFGPCYHMMEIMAQGEQRLPQWIGVVRGAADWDAVFDGFTSSVDYPACYFWKERAAHWPEAKVILSTRDAQGWFESVNHTIMSPQSVEHMRSGPLAEFTEGTVLKDFGDKVHDRTFMTDYFERWEASVIETLPPERLLVHRPGDGWEPLCAFLGVPVPGEPYPRVNTAEDMLGNRIEQNVAREASDARHSVAGYMNQMRKKAFSS